MDGSVAAPTRLLQLDTDCLEEVLARLPPQHLARVAATCKELRGVVAKRLAAVARLLLAPFDMEYEELRNDKTLRLENRGIDTADAMVLADAISKVDLPLEMLMLEDNELGDAGVQGVFGEATAGRTASLRSVCMDNNRLGVVGFAALASAAAAGSLPRLEHLSVEYNPLGDAGALSVARAVGRGAFAGLHGMYLGACEIRDEGAVALFSAICAVGAMPELVILSLHNNRFGDAGTIALSTELEVNPAGALPKLEGLRLNGNRIGDDGALALAKALTLDRAKPGALALRKLRMLDLNDNAIGEAGEFAISRVRRCHCTDACNQCTS